MSKGKWVNIPFDIDGLNMDGVIELAKKLKEEHGDKAVADVSIEPNYGDDEAVVEVRYFRPFTKAELAEEAKEEAEQEKRDREQWERLSKRYGVVTSKGVEK